MTDVDCLDLLAQEPGFVLKSKKRKALEVLLRGKDVFCVLPTALFIRCLFMQRVLQVPCNGRQSLLSRLCKKRGIGRQHTTFTPIQNTACSNELFSPSGRFCFGGKTFWLSKCEFWPLIKYISYWEVVTRILIFSGRHDLPSDARAFSFLASLEM